MKTSTIIWIVVIVIVIGGGILWFVSQNSNTSSATTQATTTAATTPSGTPTISLGSSAQFPSFLTAANGMALYTFKNDTVGVSNCSGGCAVEWPPYTVSSATGLSAASGITGTLGTITRSDGTIQVTYNGMPLYFFVKDTSAGQVTGNANDNFFVATAGPATSQPQAAAVKTTAPTTAPAPAPATPAYNY